MALSLSIPSILARVQWVFTNTGTSGDTSTASSFSYTKSLTSGTSASQADRFYAISSTLAGGATSNVDLAGSLVDVFGNTITFARIKVIYVELTADTTSTGLSVGGHATAALANWITSTDSLANDAPAVKIRNGGCFLLACTDATGYAVTATTADILKLTNLDGTNTATYKLALVGASA